MTENKLKNFTLAISVIIYFTYSPISYAETFKISKAGKYTDVQVQEHLGLHITADCTKSKPPKCDALEATKEKVLSKGSKAPFIGHPASNYCKSKNGSSRILIGKDNKQYDYCLFQDGSMIDSWDLYYKHYPKSDAN